MFKFIHTADIHLDSPLRGLETHEDAPVEEIRGATRRALEKLVDFALSEQVAFILIAGDLYDGDWKDHNTGIFFATQMGRLSEADIKVFIVSGNHDAASQITKTMPLPDNVTFFSNKKPETIKIDNLNVAIHGQSYSSRSVTTNLVSEYPGYDADCFNIGLLHTSLNGREGHEDYAPCTLDDLKSKGYQYWALGHVHNREIVSEDPFILFPGNIQGRHIKETGAKGVTLVTVVDDRITATKELACDVVRFLLCNADLSECEDMESVYKQVRLAMAKTKCEASDMTLAIRLNLVGDCPLHSNLHANSNQISYEFRGIAASLGNVWLEKVYIKTRSKRSLNDVIGEDGPLASLVQTVENMDISEEYLLTLLPDLKGLKTKLPAELLDNDTVLDIEPESLNALREGIKDLLVERMLEEEDNL